MRATHFRNGGDACNIVLIAVSIADSAAWREKDGHQMHLMHTAAAACCVRARLPARLGGSFGEGEVDPMRGLGREEG